MNYQTDNPTYAIPHRQDYYFPDPLDDEVDREIGENPTIPTWRPPQHDLHHVHASGTSYIIVLSSYTHTATAPHHHQTPMFRAPQPQRTQPAPLRPVSTHAQMATQEVPHAVPRTKTVATSKAAHDPATQPKSQKRKAAPAAQSTQTRGDGTEVSTYFSKSASKQIVKLCREAVDQNALLGANHFEMLAVSYNEWAHANKARNATGKQLYNKLKSVSIMTTS
jgi:hypothetical protein